MAVPIGHICRDRRLSPMPAAVFLKYGTEAYPQDSEGSSLASGVGRGAVRCSGSVYSFGAEKSYEGRGEPNLLTHTWLSHI